MRGEFERQEEAHAPSPDIRIEPLEVTYRGKVHRAIKLPVRTIPSDIVAYDPEYDMDEMEHYEDFKEANPVKTTRPVL